MTRSEAGSKGGIARNRLYGNPGTPEGRRRGGLRSVEANKRRHSRFRTLQGIKKPRPSAALAELCGIIAGDGSISEYHTSTTTNSVTDAEHALYTKSLFARLFGVPVHMRLLRRSNAYIVAVYSKAVGEFLVSKGLKRGHKIRASLRMPEWVRKNTGYKKSFIRGLFDTDGCVYVDTHTIKGTRYDNLGMAFTNRCLPLLADYKNALADLGLHPTQKTKYVVFLRREKEIRRYFELVGSSNPKHSRKVRKFFSRNGGVA